ncbi:MAG: hypothetical protein M9928_21145 [Anaerolineae bacterium]|nr:hypothetical protein [Anaerolineae bacterium]MCO5190851.1 hypothetical protein [Anaerolineae bacterium]MCO5195947.1 hypothetical protein [Anaerolineae bacterium]MCO5207522.1 hypothetical protein [Anaerolineae bacterium]
MADETVRTQELDEFRNRLTWLENDRHKLSRRIATLEQQNELLNRELSTRDARIKQLESQLASSRLKFNEIEKVDARIGQIQAEFTRLLTEETQNRRDAQKEMSRTQRVAHDLNVREIAAVRSQLPGIERLENAMEQRKAEESRLSKLIGQITNRFPPIEGRLEDLGNQVAYQMESHKKNSRDIGEIQSTLIDISKRWEPIGSRLDVIGRQVARAEIEIQELQATQHNNSRQVNEWMEQSKLSDYERTKRVEAWMELIEAYKTDMADFHKRWSEFAEQSKVAQQAVQTLEQWRLQIERQQNELTEVTRLEIERFQARWQEFVNEYSKFRKTFEIDNEQRWNGADRRNKHILEQFEMLDEELAVIKKDRDTLQRIYLAQTDALKQLPTIWMEEVEKAIANDPDRRREPSRITVREE